MTQEERNQDDSGQLPVERHSAFWLEQAGPGAPPLAAGTDLDEPSLDWRRLLEGLWRRKWLVLGLTLAGLAVGAFLMRRAEPVYETRATIWLGPSEDGQGPIKPADIFEGQGWADLLGSQAVLEPVARSERLFVEVESAPDTAALRSLEVTEELVPGRYQLRGLDEGRFELLRAGSEQVVQRGRLGDDLVGQPAGFRWPLPASALPAGSKYLFRAVRPTAAAQRLRGHLTVGFNPQAGNLINTRFTSTSPDRAASLHNEVLDSFMEVAQRLKSQKLREVVGILQEQTDYAAVRLDSAELALENFRVQTITLPQEGQTVSLPEGSGNLRTQSPVFDAFFQKKLQQEQVRSDLQDLRRVLQRVEQGGELDVVALRMNPVTQRSARLQNALQELTDKEANRRSLLYQYTEEYPPVQEADRRIRVLKTQVIPDLIRELVEQLEQQQTELTQQIDNQTSELQRIPTRTIQEARLRRQVEMAEQLHNNLLTRLKEAELAARTNLPDLQVVDRASPPGGPSENPGPRLFMLASMAGIGLGVGGALLLDRLDTKVRYPDQIAEGIGLKVLGLVPRIPTGRKSKGVERRHEAMEAFRAIRGQLTREASGRHSLFLITSPSPREGKTLVTANLGISFAAAGSRTLVVDCDTRRGNLETFFGRPSRPGLADILRGEAGLNECETPTEFERLTLLPHGRLRHFDPELLDSSRMDILLREVRGRYDVVLLDAPPLMAGADALMLGERTDRVLFVLRTGETDQEAARARLTGIGNFELPVAGAVLNDVPAGGRYYEYYYYSYRPDQLEGRVLTG